MQPKTKERAMNLRRANRRLPRRRLDVPLELVSFQHPEILSRFTSETGKLLPRRITGVPAWLHRKITREVKRARAVNLLP
jgi:small subunit ribosomal protein S18